MTEVPSMIVPLVWGGELERSARVLREKIREGGRRGRDLGTALRQKLLSMSPGGPKGNAGSGDI